MLLLNTRELKSYNVKQKTNKPKKKKKKKPKQKTKNKKPWAEPFVERPKAHLSR
jgi:hypothetical protein